MATVVASVALPTSRKDGTAATAADTALIRLYRDGSKVAEVAPAGVSPASLTDSNVPPGKHSYTATAVGSDGVESDPSAAEVAVIPFSPLAAPTIVSISIQ